jgi:hypothetical protein
MPTSVDQAWGGNFNGAAQVKLRKVGKTPSRSIKPVRLVGEKEAGPAAPTAPAASYYDDLIPDKGWSVFIIAAIASIVVLLISLHCKVSKLCMMQAALLSGGGGRGGGRPGPFVW